MQRKICEYMYRKLSGINKIKETFSFYFYFAIQKLKFIEIETE